MLGLDRSGYLGYTKLAATDGTTIDEWFSYGSAAPHAFELTRNVCRDHCRQHR